ncbi:hypothetical protein SLEP1_g58559 [Rubroshorea leprosula]|uniref:Protein kinase domain-containing protein n=1 Tax=Rubroshorea leprosula TaxID=152421 RepID=A0AAV5MPS6_9ROSI|nr:hypothetical protein SLEP1_g58559 [Rubroshorea leprosula]
MKQQYQRGVKWRVFWPWDFRFSKHFGSKYELGEEVGKGHFGYTYSAKFKKGELKGQQVAIKVIPKAKYRDEICWQTSAFVSPVP